jgi:hypothetical protein
VYLWRRPYGRSPFGFDSLRFEELKTGYKDVKQENGLQDEKVSKKETGIEIVY